MTPVGQKRTSIYSGEPGTSIYVHNYGPSMVTLEIGNSTFYVAENQTFTQDLEVVTVYAWAETHAKIDLVVKTEPRSNMVVAPSRLPASPPDTGSVISSVTELPDGSLTGPYALYALILIDPESGQKSAVGWDNDNNMPLIFASDAGTLGTDTGSCKVAIGPLDVNFVPSLKYRLLRSYLTDTGSFPAPGSYTDFVEIDKSLEPNSDFIDDGTLPTLVPNFAGNRGPVLRPALEIKSGVPVYAAADATPILLQPGTFSFYQTATGLRIKEYGGTNFPISSAGKVRFITDGNPDTITPSDLTVSSPEEGQYLAFTSGSALANKRTPFSTGNRQPIPVSPKEDGTRIIKVESFDVNGNWTNHTGAAGTIDTTVGNFKSGTGSLKFTATGGRRAVSLFTGINASAHDKRARIRWLVDAGSTITNVTIRFYSGGSTANVSSALQFTNAAGFTAGWHQMIVEIPTGTGSGAYDNTNVTGMAVEVTMTAGAIYFDQAVIIAPKSGVLPTFIFTFDDGYPQQFTIMAAYLEKYGYRGVFPVTFGNIVPNNITLDMVKEMDGRGHLIVGHSKNHLGNWYSLPLAQQREEVEYMRWYLQRNGLGRGADIYFVNNGWGTAGYDTLRMLLEQHRCVVPYPQAHFENIAGMGFQWDNLPFCSNTPLDRRILWRNERLIDVAFTTAAVDTVIANKELGMSLNHWLSDYGGINGTHITYANFKAVVDYIRTKELAGLCRVMCLDEYLDEAA